MNALFTILIVLPFLIGILLANVAERSENVKVLHTIYLVLMNAGLLFAGLLVMMLGALQPMIAAQQNMTLPKVDWLGGGLALTTGAAVALIVLLPPVRRLMARLFRIDPRSPVHTAALSMSATVLGGNLFQMVLSSAILTPQGMQQLQQQGQDLSLSFVDTLVFPLLTLSLAALLGVGVFIRRDWGAAMQRLGLIVPKPIHGVAAVAVTVALLALAVGADKAWAVIDPAGQQQVGGVSSALLGNFNGLAGALAVGLTAGIGEELFFRGAYQPRFGILFAALLFASFHVQYFMSVSTLLVFLVGIVLGILRQRTSLTICILVHFLYNFAAMLMPSI